MSVPDSAPLDEISSLYSIRHKNMFIRTLPFLVMALVAESSLALPPGPASARDTILSIVLLAATGACFMLPYDVLPPWLNISIPLCYVASTLAMILAAGGSSAGVGLVVLLPILWSALNLRPWQTYTVVLAVAVIEWVTTYVPLDLSDSIRLRREVAWIAIGGLVAYAIHDIRSRIENVSEQRALTNIDMAETIDELNERNRAASILSNLVESLNFCDVLDEAYSVFDDAAREIFATAGSISILNPSGDQLEQKCSWRDFDGVETHFSSNQCRALQSGRHYESNLDNPPCAHLRNNSLTHVLCQPLLIQKEIIGVLTVSLTEDGELSPLADRFRQYAMLLGDQISIWMANFTLRESLQNLSIRDPLTNLFNRRFMVETLTREMSITTRSHDQTSIIQMDVDHFKQFNDSYGHEVGDSVLRAVADVMLNLFRDSDVPCRSGGEEFTLILPRCSWDIANVRAIELQSRVSEMDIAMPNNQTPPRPPTLSIGIATSPEHGTTGEELMRAADKALYAAKAGGRNQIVRAEESVDDGRAETTSNQNGRVIDSSSSDLVS
jgi:diguanylate cyclase (GGDEF)-like protein